MLPVEAVCYPSKQAPQAGPAGHTVPASCGQEPQKARPRLAWPGERCSPVMGWPGACGKAHSFHAHAQQPCRGPWQVMVYREEGCAHCGDQESSMFRPSQIIPGSRCVPRSWLLAHRDALAIAGAISRFMYVPEPRGMGLRPPTNLQEREVLLPLLNHRRTRHAAPHGTLRCRRRLAHSRLTPAPGSAAYSSTPQCTHSTRSAAQS